MAVTETAGDATGQKCFVVVGKQQKESVASTDFHEVIWMSTNIQARGGLRCQNTSMLSNIITL